MSWLAKLFPFLAEDSDPNVDLTKEVTEEEWYGKQYSKADEAVKAFEGFRVQPSNMKKELTEKDPNNPPNNNSTPPRR
jgi:hypothetical protein